jgi:hypothetical protein
MTGKWSETRQCFYGVVRAAKDPQRLLNKAISDFSDSLHYNPQGGVMIEKGAIAGSMRDFVQTWPKMRSVTILNDNAISQNKVMMKPVSDAPAAGLKMIEYAEMSIMACPGVTPSFMGLDDSLQNQYDVYGQKVRQGLTVLSPYFDARTFYIIDQGELFIDCLKVLAENSNGYVVRKIRGDTSIPYQQVQLTDIATEYEIITTEAPKTPDEMAALRDTLLKIMELLTKVGRDPAAILPEVLETMELPQDKIEAIEIASQPPPPPEPDPNNIALIQAQTADLNAGAELKKAQAVEKNHGIIVSQAALQNGLELDQMKADLDKTKAQTAEILAKIGEMAQAALNPQPAQPMNQ